MSNRNDTDDGLGVTLQVLFWIVVSALLFCVLLSIRSTVRANQPGPCQETAFNGNTGPIQSQKSVASTLVKECKECMDRGSPARQFWH